METRDAGPSLSISSVSGQDRVERRPVPAGVYEAEYRVLLAKMETTRYGEKKSATLLFKITKGPYKDQITSFKGWLFRTNDGRWLVGSKSELAEVIRTITGGSNDLDDSHKGRQFVIEVKTRLGTKVDDKTGQPVPFHYVTKVLAKPGGPEPEAPPAAPGNGNQASSQQGKQAPAAPPATAQAKPSGQDRGLLDDLTELGDFDQPPF